MRRFAFLTLCASLVSAQTPVAGIGNFSHIVQDFDRALAFYRDVIGLEVNGTPGAFNGNPAILALGNTPGAQSRFVALKIPGSQMGVELIQYKDIDRKAVEPSGLQDPGAANLILSVRDLNSILARVKKAGTRVVSKGGVPADIGGGSRVVFLRDPDGFFIEISERKPAPQTTAPAAANVIGGNFEMIVEDTAKSMKFYREGLGFQPMVGETFDGRALLMDTAGTPGAQFKRSVATIPNTPVSMAFLEFKGIKRTPLHTRTQDPGTPILQLRVRDVAAATQALKAAGGEVITTGGKPVAMGNNSLVLVRGPDNLFFELLPAPNQ